MKLIYTKTKKEVKIGDNVKTFRNEKCEVISITKPHKPSSTGRVTVKIKGNDYEEYFFPGVIDAEWIERED